MSACSERHRKLDAMGEGRCSVPMWSGGGPAGFCDRPAYGERPECREFRNYASGEMYREDGRYNGYVPGLACSRHGGPKVRTFMDGNAWCAVRPDFINLQESPAGFGATRELALATLQGEARMNERINALAEEMRLVDKIAAEPAFADFTRDQCEDMARRIMEMSAARFPASADLRAALADIHTFAHRESSGPEVPDDLWTVREMAAAALAAPPVGGERLARLAARLRREADDLLSEPGSAVHLIAKADERRATADEIDAALAALSAPAAPVAGEWHDGAPPKPWATEWFIAETTHGERVVLAALPEDYTYDFKTADETYLKREKIARWMQFPDSQFIAPVSAPAAPVAGDVVITTDNTGRCVLVSRQDDEGRILSILWEADGESKNWAADGTYTASLAVPAPVAEDMPVCRHCGDTGDVHRADGEYLGPCDCGAFSVGLAARLAAEPAHAKQCTSRISLMSDPPQPMACNCGAAAPAARPSGDDLEGDISVQFEAGFNAGVAFVESQSSTVPGARPSGEVTEEMVDRACQAYADARDSAGVEPMVNRYHCDWMRAALLAALSPATEPSEAERLEMGRKAWADVPDAAAWVREIRGNEDSPATPPAAEGGEWVRVPREPNSGMRAKFGDMAWRGFDACYADLLAASPTPPAAPPGVEEWQPMATAPRDGTLLRLLVRFTLHPTEDDEVAPTIGSNNFNHDGENLWQFAGWNWCQDEWTQGAGEPIGWLPMIRRPAASEGGSDEV